MVKSLSCLICGSKAEYVFTSSVLAKYQVKYYHCKECFTLFTESPYWLNEAYVDSISNADTGILARNQFFFERLSLFLTLKDSKDWLFKVLKFLPLSIVFRIFKKYFNRFDGRILDVGGGYGLLVRSLRDLGLNAFWSDIYTSNIFSKGFESNALDANPNVICAFEVLEHLENPVEQIGKWLADYAPEYFIFSTVLKNSEVPEKDWWYYSFSTGQHIVFYSEMSLRIIAEIFGYSFYSDGHSFHLFSKSKINPNAILDNVKLRNKAIYLFRSLYVSKIESDSKLFQNKEK